MISCDYPSFVECNRASSSDPYARPKTLKRLLHDSKGDANLQGFRVTDPLDFQFAESFDEPVGELIGASADPDLGHAEAQDDLPVQPLI
jgi:hypothetical protein